MLGRSDGGRVLMFPFGAVRQIRVLLPPNLLEWFHSLRCLVFLRLRLFGE